MIASYTSDLAPREKPRNLRLPLCMPIGSVAPISLIENTVDRSSVAIRPDRSSAAVARTWESRQGLFVEPDTGEGRLLP